MNKYENGKIYKIEAINGDEGDIYIGSTTEKYLSNRMGKHRNNYKNRKNATKPSIVTAFKLFDKYGIDNCVITLLEIVSCQCIEELLAKERIHIQSLNCVNRIVPLRTYKEWCQDNKEDIKEKAKIYNEVNKEKLIKNRKDHYANNKDQHKKKYLKRREETLSKTFVCDCGAECWSMNKNRHIKTKKHQDFLMSQSK